MNPQLHYHIRQLFTPFQYYNVDSSRATNRFSFLAEKRYQQKDVCLLRI